MTNYLNSGIDVLDMDQVQRLAPSIFTEGSYDKLSKNYRQISTAVALNSLMEEGFQPYKVRESRTRNENKVPYVRHAIQLRKPSDKPVMIGDSVEELVLTNSHDGTTAFKLFGGFFRFVCLNGMVVGDKTMSYRVMHKGDPQRIADAVAETAHEAMAMFTRVNEYRERMQEVTLNEELQLAFASEALNLKFGQRTPTLTPNQFLEARRVDDDGDSVWQAYNRVQENGTKGGLTPDRALTGRRTRRTRPITSISEDISFNRELWNAAVKYMELAA